MVKPYPDPLAPNPTGPAPTKSIRLIKTVSPKGTRAVLPTPHLSDYRAPA